MAFVFSMSYPESFALACTVIALLAAYRDRWLLAMVLAAVGVLARPEAIVLDHPARRTRLVAASPALTRASAGARSPRCSPHPRRSSSYPLYLKWSLHYAGAWGKAQQAWGRAFRLSGPYRALVHLPSKIVAEPVIGRDLIFFVVYVALVVYAARHRVPRAVDRRRGADPRAAALFGLLRVGGPLRAACAAGLLGGRADRRGARACAWRCSSPHSRSAASS